MIPSPGSTLFSLIKADAGVSRAVILQEEEAKETFADSPASQFTFLFVLRYLLHMESILPLFGLRGRLFSRKGPLPASTLRGDTVGSVAETLRISTGAERNSGFVEERIAV